ncbi:MAG: zinc-binding dehydrogenase [Acidimicrobiales bacterium]
MPEPSEGQVLVKTHAASICGSDLHVVCHGVNMPPVPCAHGYPGHEAIGEIVASSGSDTSALPVGTNVLCFPPAHIATCFGDYQALGSKYVLPLPECDVTAAELLMAQQLGTVIFAAKQWGVEVEGRSVMVIGQGSAGLFWASWLRHCGAASIIASDPVAERRAASAHFGVDTVLDPRSDDIEAALRDLTGPGPDLVVEAVGTKQTLNDSVNLVRPDGNLMWFGLPDSDQAVPIEFSKFFRKRLRAASTYGAQDEPSASSFQTALDLISSGAIDVKPLLSQTFSIEDIDQAIVAANQPFESGALKVSVTF